MPVELSRPEVVWGVLVFVGIAAMALNRLGLVRFQFRFGNGKDMCPDPGCHKSVEDIGADLQELCNTMKVDIFPKINRTAEAVARIEGWIQGKQG